MLQLVRWPAKARANMKSDFQNELVRKLAGFLHGIGLSVISGKVEDETFLPGIQIKDGELVVDEHRLAYPGDLLHEAGHLAMVPGAMRKGVNGELTNEVDTALIEVAAIAWSYAACIHLDIEPHVVFHPAGYHGKSEALLLGFSVGVYPGVNQLQAAGLTVIGAEATARNLPPFAHMIKWLRD